MRNRAFLKVVLLGLLTFAFVPGLAGAASQGQDLTGMLASSAAERAVAVSGPIISVTPASHDFSRVNVGSSSGNFDFTIMNTGDATLNISSLSLVGDPGFAGSAVSLSIPAGGSTLLHTSFTPASSGSKSTNLSINSNASNGTFSALLFGVGNTAPTFSPPLAASYNLSAHVAFSLTTSATDAEGDAVTYTIASVPALPVGATFDGNSGAFSWTPNTADAGDYAVTVTASDGLASTPGTFTLHVTSTNNPPVANVGGPYSGVTGIPISFNGSASSDPDAGQTLTYAWDFGDGGTATGATPSHTYTSPGTRLVTLTVTDNGSPALSNSATTTASVVNFIPISIVQITGALPIVKTNGNGVQRLGIECLTRAVTDIDPASIRISTTYPNAGTVSEVSIAPRGVKVGDINGNGFGDLDFSFRASEIKPLLIHVPNGTLVTLVFTAKTISDAVTLRGTIDLTKSGSANVTSAVAGNPFKLQTNIQYTLRDSGPVQIRIYSVNGQLVRTLREELATPGAYEVRWNGKDDGGRTAPSGIYFVSVKQGTESSQTRVVLER
jgi:PKD repeat protein